MDDTQYDALTSKLLRVMADYIDIPVERLTPETTFESLQLDSLDFIELVFLVEEHVGVSLDGALEDLRHRMLNASEPPRRALRRCRDRVAARGDW